MLSVFGDTPRGGAMEARKAHNLEVAGSSPAPATAKNAPRREGALRPRRGASRGKLQYERAA